MEIKEQMNKQDKKTYLDTQHTFSERAIDLVGRMTLEEKISQIGNAAPPIPRLGVGAYNWWKEAIHGVRDGQATSFPHGMGIAASWNRELVRKLATVIGDEGRVQFLSSEGPRGLNYWCPTFNMLKDPRWGRAEESYGEDPYLAGEIATAFIKGMQGIDKYTKTMATSKHFLGNSSDSNRCTGSSNIEMDDLYEYYTPAFKKTVEEGNVRALMTSYNCVNDIPMSVNEELLTELVRKKWGFDGFYVTDCDTLVNIQQNYSWRPKGFKQDESWEYKQIVSLALEAGVDLNCGRNYQMFMLEAIRAGLTTEDALDKALVRLFTERMRTGEFDGELCSYNTAQYEKAHQIGSSNHTALAEQASDEAIVLLKNDKIASSGKPLLPLGKDIKKLVVVGDYADKVILGDYSTTDPINTSTPLEGITRAARKANTDMAIEYIRAYSNDSLSLLTASHLKMYGKDGEYLGSFPLSEAEHYKTEYFKYINGGLEIISNAVDGAWIRFPNTIDLTDVEYFSIGAGGDFNPTRFTLRQGNPVSGTLLGEISVAEQTPNNWTYKEHKFKFIGREGGYNKPLDSIYLTFKADYSIKAYEFTSDERTSIQEADAVVIYVGTLPGQNGYRESSDGNNVNLVNFQNELISKVASLNTRCIVYMQAVTEVNVEPFKEKVPAMLWCTYNGQAQGNAAGRILFGEVSPSAKLPFTWYKDVNELADIKDYTIKNGGTQVLEPSKINKGRTYQYFTGEVTYPFGYGLSYLEVTYSNLRISSTAVTPNDSIQIDVDVTNTTEYEGKTVVQVYVVPPKEELRVKPFKQLKGFDKVHLMPNETKTCHMTIPISELYIFDSKQFCYSYPNGVYKIEVGEDSQRAEELTAEFIVQGELDNKIQHFTLEPSGHFLKQNQKDAFIYSRPYAVYNNMLKVPKALMDITYISSNPNVAVVGLDGKVSPAPGGEKGIANIRALLKVNGETKISEYLVQVI